MNYQGRKKSGGIMPFAYYHLNRALIEQVLQKKYNYELNVNYYSH